MKRMKRIAALTLALMLAASPLAGAAFAETETEVAAVEVEDAADGAGSELSGFENADVDAEADADAEGAEEESAGALEGGAAVDADVRIDADSDELFERYLEKQTLKGDTLSADSVKGSRLKGNDLKYYKYYASIIKDVCAGDKTNSTMDLSVKKIAGKSSFTAKDLGLSRLAYNYGGRWYLTEQAADKLYDLLLPGNLNSIYKCLQFDLGAEGYWVSWYSSYNWYDYSFSYTLSKNKISFRSGSGVTICIPVAGEFAKSAGSGSYYVYKANGSKINTANRAIKRSLSIVSDFDRLQETSLSSYNETQQDVLRLAYYFNEVCGLTEYDDYAAYTGEGNNPWSMINVLDGDPNTLAVCEGYAKAFKYLCDMSVFNSPWIDCQLAEGFTSLDWNEGHMWNTVRMNDGLNYLVDPTWADQGDYADLTEWFLRGDPYGSATYFTVEGVGRKYRPEFNSIVAPAERTLAPYSKYSVAEDLEIKLPSVSISKLTKAKKAFTVKWSSVTKPLGTLYVDGYQIQYSRSKSFKNASSVKVSGYASSSKKIKKLKSKKTYYVRIRSYAKLGGKTYYSGWSKVKKVKTK